MITWEEKPHWSFALGVALVELNRLIAGPDVANLESMGSTGVPDPDDLLAIIDGFLGERDSLYDGDVARLERDRTAVQEIVAPAYQAGLEAARQLWATSSPEEHARLAEYQHHEVLEEAWRKVPTTFSGNKASSNEINWFLEAFCRQWSEFEYDTYLQGTTE